MNLIFLYKIGNWFFRMKIPFIPLIFKFLIRLIFNSAVDPCTKIGKGSFFAYGGIAVVIHKNTIIGENVVISQCVTIGGRSKSKGVPRIGDNVYIAPGSKILGDIVVGHDSVIGANAVVIKDVPPNCVVAGVPAKIIKENINPKEFY